MTAAATTGVNPGRSAVKFLLDSNVILYHLNERLNKDLPLITRNSRDFQPIAGLTLIDPFQPSPP